MVFVEIKVGWVDQVVDVFDKQNVVVSQWQVWGGVGDYLGVEMVVFFGIDLNCWGVGGVNVGGVIDCLLIVFNYCVVGVFFQLGEGFGEQGGFVGVGVGNQIQYQLLFCCEVCVVVCCQVVVFIQYVDFYFQYLLLVLFWGVGICFVVVVMQVVFWCVGGGEVVDFDIGDGYCLVWGGCEGGVVECGMWVLFVFFNIEVVFVIVVCCIYNLF